MSDGSERSAWLSSMNNEWETQEHMVSERYGESMGKYRKHRKIQENHIIWETLIRTHIGKYGNNMGNNIGKTWETMGKLHIGKYGKSMEIRYKWI